MHGETMKKATNLCYVCYAVLYDDICKVMISVKLRYL